MNTVSKLKLWGFCSAGLALLSVGSACFAGTIIVKPNTVISQPTTYDSVTLDMTKGSFLIKNHASLTVTNSTITGTLSPDNPYLINIDDGSINLSHNTVKLSAQDIAPHPKTQSLQHMIQVALGTVTLDHNDFSIDKQFSAGFLVTTASIATTGFKITHNHFEHFHGVLYLITSDNNLIAENTFNKNSYGNLVNIGNNNSIIHNTIYYSGNNHLGNAMDIIDSNNVNIQNNILMTPTCHGIYVLNSHNLLIDNNRVMGGITYAMNIYTYAEKAKIEAYVKDIVAAHKMHNVISSNITVTNNYMAQNRFGLAASDVDTLVVKSNYFVQRFEDNDSRKFWTDNAVLLKQVTNLTWADNLYKEAFTQDSMGDNSKSFQFVTFPASGGISL